MAITAQSSPQDDLAFLTALRGKRGAPAGRNDSRRDDDIGPSREQYRAAMDAVLVKYGDEKQFMAALEGASPARSSIDVTREAVGLAAPKVETPSIPRPETVSSPRSPEVLAVSAPQSLPSLFASLAPQIAAPAVALTALPSVPARSPTADLVDVADATPAEATPGFSLISSASAGTPNPWDNDPIEPTAAAPAAAPWNADPIDAPAARPSLGDRVRVNAEQAFSEGTLAGKMVADARSGEADRGRSDAAYRELDKRTYPSDFPSDFEVQRPDAPGISGLPPSDQAAIRRAPDAELRTFADARSASADAQRAEFLKADEARRAEYDAMPGFSTPSEGIAALIGQLAGGAASPESLVPVGRGATALKTFAEGAAVNAGTSAIVEPVVQRSNIALNRQEAADPEAALISTAMSALIGGTFNVAPQAASALGARLRGLFGKDKVADLTPDELAQAVSADPETREILKQAGATDEQINAMSDPAAMAERVSARRAEDAAAQAEGTRPLTTNAEARAAETEAAKVARAAEKGARKVPGELTPDEIAAARQAGEQPPPSQPPEVMVAGAPVRTGGGAPEATTARPAGELDPGTEAGMARARGDDIGARIGEDPAALVESQLGIPRATYDTLPAEARERVVAAAQRQRAAETPAPARSTTDAALGEGERVYSPATKPMDGAGEAGRGVQPTDAEIDATNPNYARAATGTADRPTRMDDSSGLDFQTRDPETGRPTDDRAAGFEQRATEQASAARAATEEDLIREWQQRAQSRPGKGDSDAEARRQYEGGSGKNFSTKAAPQDADGRYGTDEFGFVRSDKGGPVRYADQKQAAKWILNVGHKTSPDQIFEIHNHPSGKGFAVRERGRGEAAAERGQDAGNGQGRSAPEPSASAAEAPRALLARQDAADGGDAPSQRPETEAPQARQDGEAVARNEGGMDAKGSEYEATVREATGGGRDPAANDVMAKPERDAAAPGTDAGRDRAADIGARDERAPGDGADPGVARKDEGGNRRDGDARNAGNAAGPDAARGDGAAEGTARPVTLTSGVDSSSWPDPPTRTAAFRRWFGDSKAVDDGGAPLVVYHGTAGDFDTFDITRATDRTGDFEDSHIGVFFSTSPTAAGVFAIGDKRRAGNNVMPAYLSIKNPLVIDLAGDKYTLNRAFGALGEALGQQFDHYRKGDGLRIREELKRQGYDGVKVVNSRFGKTTPAVARLAGGEVGDNTTWIALNPEQIKSATGNRGTFDKANPNILYSGLDPELAWRLLGKPVAAAIKREIPALAKDTTRVRALLKASPSMSAIVQTLANWGAAITYSNRGVMHMLRDRYDGKAAEIIGKIADAIGTDPGSGRKVGQTYEEGVNQHAYSRINRMSNIVGEDNLDDRALAAEVGDILAGRKGRQSDKARTIADRLRKMLDETRQYMIDAGVEIGFRPDYFPRSLDHDKVAKDAAGFEKDAAALYRKMGLSADDAKQAAMDWREREMGLGTAQHKLQGVHSDFTKGRTLPAEADQMMANWYNRDSFEVLSGYFRQAARLAEFTRRFGKGGKELDDMLGQLGREGVSEADVWMLRKSIDSSLGLLNGTAGSIMTSATSTIQTIGILRALPRAVWSSLAEPLAYGVRTGNALDGLKAIAGTVGEVFGSKRLDDQREVAEFLGIVGDSLTHMLLAGQFGGGQAGKINNTILARFFNRSGLQPLTEAQRTAGVKIGQGFIGKLLRDVAQETGYAKSSGDMLADLGIDGADAAKLSKWLGKLGGMPKVADLMGDSPEARMYGGAILRFVDEAIQNPKAVDRPMLANHPVGRLAYGIMSFMYTYTRNVTYRLGNQAYRAAVGKGYTARDRAALALGPGAALMVLAAVQTGVAKLRDELTNPDEAEARPTELSVIQYASRAGGFGNLDPIVNAVLGAKYERDLTGIIAGPYVGQYLQDMQKFVGLVPAPIGKNSPNTNSAEWNAARAAYNMVGVPLAATALALAPGGPILNKGYGALIASPLGPIGGVSATAPLSPQASSDFATMVAGDRPDRWRKAGGGKFKGKFD